MARSTWASAKASKATPVSDLEVAGMRGEAVFCHQTAGAVVDAEVEAGKILVGDGRAVNADALVDALKVRRGVKAHAVAGALENRGERGCRGAFAVGAGDEHGAKTLLRMAEGFDQRAHLLEPKLAPRLTGGRVQLADSGVKTVERRSVRHEFRLQGAGCRVQG